MNYRLRLRKIFTFILSTTILVLVTGFALILARGNSITPQGIVSTGTIRLSIDPTSGFSVQLNEQRHNVTNGNAIEGLAPGEYTLKIEKEGFSSWQQQVQIRAGLITDLSVQLFPAELQLEQLTKTSVTQAFFSPLHAYVYYTVLDSELGTNIGLWQQTLQQSLIPLIEERPVKLTNLTDVWQQAAQDKSLQIWPSDNDRRLILWNGTDYYILDTGRYNEPAAANRLQLPYPIDELSWLQDDTNLLIKSGNMLIDYNLNTQTSNIITYSQSLVYTTTQDALIYLSSEGLLKNYVSGKSTELVLENVTLPGEITLLKGASANVQNLIIGAKGELYFLNTVQSLLLKIGPGELMSVSPTGRQLLVREEDSIVSYEVDISLISDEVKAQRRNTGLTLDLDVESIEWNPGSSFFAFQKQGETGKVYSSDNAGNNINLVLLSDSINNSNYSIPADNSGLVILLNDTISGGTADRNNLYKLKFE